MSDELEIYRKIKKGNFETLDDLQILDDMLKDFDEYLEQAPGLDFSSLEEMAAEELDEHFKDFDTWIKGKEQNN